MRYCLVASSEIGIQQSLKMILSGSFQTLIATTGREALALLAEKPIDILFLDTNLSDHKGLSLVDEIDLMNIRTSVVLIASSQSTNLIQNARHANVHEILFKPFEKEHVLFIATRLLERNTLVKKVHHLERRRQTAQTPTLGPSELEQGMASPSKVESSLDRSVHYKQFAMREFFKALTHIADLNRLLDYAIKGIVEIFGVNKASIMLLEKPQFQYEIKVAMGLDEIVMDSVRFDISSGCPAWFLRFNQILSREEAERNLHTQEGMRVHEEMERVQAVLSAPLLSKGKLLGILNLGNKVTGKPFWDEDFELVSMISSYLAVAVESSSLYREVSFQKRYNENILESISSGVVTIDRGGSITTYNKSAQSILQIAFQEVYGKHIQKLGSVFADLLLRTLEGEGFFNRHEIVYPLTRAPLGISTSQIKEDGEHITGAIMVFSDLTQAKELEKNIQTVERLNFWSNLANRMAQEIKNPLVAIKTFAQLFPERYQDAEFRKSFYEVVNTEIDRLNLMTEKLMEFAVPRESQLEEADINEIIDQAVVVNEKEIASHKARIIKRLSEEPLIANVDKKNLQEAFSNLIENCLEAIPEGGRLRIVSSLQSNKAPSSDEKAAGGRFARVEFHDNGKGISPENLKNIFSPFFSTKIRGMGFGLPIAQRIIQDHNGKIEIDTQAEKGTSFLINIPVSERGAA